MCAVSLELRTIVAFFSTCIELMKIIFRIVSSNRPSLQIFSPCHLLSVFALERLFRSPLSPTPKYESPISSRFAKTHLPFSVQSLAGQLALCGRKSSQSGRSVPEPRFQVCLQDIAWCYLPVSFINNHSPMIAWFRAEKFGPFAYTLSSTLILKQIT